MLKRLLSISIIVLASISYLKADEIGETEVKLTYTISAPGSYVFGHDITNAPIAPNSIIINILSSNVIVDLGLHIITQLAGNLLPGLDAIVVGTGLTNVTIKNAVIKGVSGVGIRVGNNCTKIQVANSTIEGCNVSGVLLNGTLPGVIGFEMKDSRILTCTGAAGAPAYGLRVIKSASILVDNCIFAQNDASTTSSGYGVNIENSQQVAIKNSTVSSNGGTGIAAGIACTACTKIFLSNCFCENNINRDTTYSGSAFGIWINQCSNVLVSKCRGAANSNTSSNCYGIAVQDGQESIIEDSITGFNSATQQCAGIMFRNEYRSQCLRSEIRGNKTTVSGTAYGMLLSGTCGQCFIEANKIISNSGASSTFGIQDHRNPSTTLVLSNLAYNNGTNYSVTYPLGVVLPVSNVSMSGFPGFTNLSSANYENVNVTP